MAIKHGHSRTVEHRIWCGIKSRCFNQTHKQFADYGGRGISMHPEWQKSFLSFLEHIGKRPTPKHSLDRIDNSKGYEPGNLRWATQEQQSNNQRSNRKLTHNGKTQTQAQWAKELGIKQGTLSLRLKSGMSIEQALVGANLKTVLIEFNGVTDSLSGWARRTGIRREALHKRIRVRGWSPEQALTTFK